MIAYTFTGRDGNAIGMLPMPDDAVEKLREYLDSTGVGDPTMLITLLASAWENLSGSDEAAMEAHKLDRLEKPSWDPPELSFTIERHGGTVQGSSRAELQDWNVNLDDRVAEHVEQRLRQVRAMRQRLDAASIAKEIAAAVVAGHDDPRLEWGRDRASVRILTTKAVNVDSAPKATVEGRRNRLNVDLAPLLENAGWQRASQAGRWEKGSPASA